MPCSLGVGQGRLGGLGGVRVGCSVHLQFPCPGPLLQSWEDSHRNSLLLTALSSQLPTLSWDYSATALDQPKHCLRSKVNGRCCIITFPVVFLRITDGLGALSPTQEDHPALLLKSKRCFLNQPKCLSLCCHHSHFL